MKLTVEIDGRRFAVDLENGRSLAIQLEFNGPQPNHFGVAAAEARPVEVGEFVGDTRRGGSCNVQNLSMIPHCNGTHTETVSHIVHDSIPISGAAGRGWYLARLVSVTPVAARETTESYRPELDHHDTVITRQALRAVAPELAPATALVIRTLPNSPDKKTIAWGNPEFPAFLTVEAMQWVVDQPIEHLLIDLPSVDKMYDEGLLTNHHLFWKVPEAGHELMPETQSGKTITEMIFADDELADGLYLLNLQVPAFGSDAAPSRPILFPVSETGG